MRVLGSYLNKKDYIASIVKWMLSFCIAFVIINVALFFYERSAGWIDLENAPTESVWRPGAMIIHSLEGRGEYMVDSNGYLNDSTDLADEFILAVGASHTAGKEIKHGYRYSDILNNIYSDGAGKVNVYNVSQDGFYLEDMIKHFDSLIETFPDSKVIIYEIGKISIPEEDICISNKGRNNIQYSTKDSIKFAIKEWIPLFNVIKRQFLTLQESRPQRLVGIDEGRLSGNITDISDLIKYMGDAYDGKIIFVYHPHVVLSDDGMEFVEDINVEEFRKICEANNMYFINMREAFSKAYEDNRELPYGFMNTALGDGHLNKNGHRMIAEEIYKLLEEIQ